jgi:hypothetical protein
MFGGVPEMKNKATMPKGTPIITPAPPCVHKWTYGGVKYEFSEYKCPGSGSYYVWYYDWFYCEKCAFDQYQKLPTEHDSYQHIRFNATPKRRVL